MREKGKNKVLVVGSFVMDLIVSTGVFPRTGETVLGEAFNMAPGGKGANQAVQMARLGMDVTMVGAVGQDVFGDELLSSASESGIDVSYVKRYADVPSAIGNVILEVQSGLQTQNRIIVVPGANMAIRPEDTAFLSDIITDYEMVLLQQEIPEAVNEAVAGLAREHGIPVMLNPAPARPVSPEFLQQITYLSPNEHEARVMTGLEANDPVSSGSVSNLAGLLGQELQKTGVPSIIMTLGEHGAVYMGEDQEIHSPSIHVEDVVDPTAAGDSFIGAYCTALVRGLDQKQAISMANHTAALTVSRMGAQSSLPDLQELISFMEEKGAEADQLVQMKGWMTDV